MEFIEEFKKINKEEQKKYIINTNNYFYGNNFDPNYVLFFRRTLEANIDKPEEYWSSEFMKVVNGLRN